MAICLCFRNDFHTLIKKTLIVCPLPSERRRAIKQAKRSACSMHWVAYAHKLVAHSVQFSRSFTSDSLQPPGLQHARPPCPSPTPRVYSHSCPSSRWCHPAISASVVPFSSHLQSFPASGNESILRIRWPEYRSFSFSISLSNEYSGLISFRIDWLDLLPVQGTLIIN